MKKLIIFLLLIILFALNGCTVASENPLTGTAANDTPPSVLVSIEEWDGEAADALEFIYEDGDYKYYLSSIRSDKIMLTFDNGKRLSLREAISQQKINIDDLIINGLQVYTEQKEEWADEIIEFTPVENTPDAIPEHGSTVDLGCCVKDIMVRETAVLGANTVTHASNGFIMTLNSDKKVYKTTDIINIWGTLEYVGDNDFIEIWHSCPFMLFSISDGNNFDIGGMTIDILTSSILHKNRVYHFDYQKSGGYNENAPDAEYWRNFFSEPDLLLPKGEYTIKLHGHFGLTERTVESRSGLVCELPIIVEP